MGATPFPALSGRSRLNIDAAVRYIAPDIRAKRLIPNTRWFRGEQARFPCYSRNDCFDLVQNFLEIVYHWENIADVLGNFDDVAMMRQVDSLITSADPLHQTAGCTHPILVERFDDVVAEEGQLSPGMGCGSHL